MTDPRASTVWSCPFCRRSDGKRSKEHIIADRFNGLINGGVGPINHDNEIRGLDGKMKRTQFQVPLGPFDQTVNDPCKECNQGWMNDIDTAALELVVRLSRAESFLLSVEDQKTLRTWFFKTALVMTLSSRPAPRLDRHLDYLYAEREAPRDVVAHFAFCEEKAPNHGGRHLYVRNGNEPPEGQEHLLDAMPHSHAVSFGLDRLYFTVGMSSRTGAPAKNMAALLRAAREAGRHTWGESVWVFLDPSPHKPIRTPHIRIPADILYASGGVMRYKAGIGLDADGWKLPGM